MNSQANNWSAYWRQDGAGGEVFVGPEGEANAEIAAFWRSLFKGVTRGARVVDIASGAGSIFGNLGGADDFELVAADLSVDALEMLRMRIHGAAVVAASASALPFCRNSFDLVVSQFGVEYAGLAAFDDALGLLKPGGQLVALSHVRDGFIDRKNATLQAGVGKAEETGFIVLAADLTRAAFRGVGVEEAVRRFQLAEREMAAFVAQHPGGLHGHLYSGFRQLFERRARYDESDILGWLDGMASEIDLNRMRLHEMRKAALDDADIETLRSAAARIGVSLNVSQMTLAGHAAPVAWRIEGLRG